MTEEQFQQLHHMQNRATIAGHRSYCEERNDFQNPEHSGNPGTRDRLAHVLARLNDGADWQSAITEALREIPI